MKKILILLLLIVPLLGNAQYWYRADAMRFKFGDNLEEWEKCNLRVFIDKDLNVKIFSLEKTINVRSVNDDYTLKEDNKGNSRLSWVCVDDEGEKCMSILTSDKNVTFIHLGIHFPAQNFAVFYNLKPERPD